MFSFSEWTKVLMIYKLRIKISNFGIIVVDTATIIDNLLLKTVLIRRYFYINIFANCRKTYNFKLKIINFEFIVDTLGFYTFTHFLL